MQTKGSGCLELRQIAFFFMLSFLVLPPLFGEERKNSETVEQRGRVNTYLATQERGRQMQGKVIRKPLEVSPKKTLKKLETHPPKSFRTKAPQKETIERPLEGKKSIQKPFKGKPLGLKEKSRFKSDTIKRPLKITE